MKSTIILAALLILCSCSSTKRTKYSDKNMRIMVDPSGLDSRTYARVQTALARTGVWTVLDRASGLRAAMREQNQLHVYNHDRYAAREKFAHWGKLYGVGAIVVASQDCQNRVATWNNTMLKTYCNLFINLIDANTGEVIVAVEDEDDTNFLGQPDWNEIVEMLVEAYPKKFEKEVLDERLVEYKEESFQHSNKMDRKNSR